MAALVAVLLALPAAGSAADGDARNSSGGAAPPGNSGGGATYYEAAPAEQEISLEVASGAWVGRATRIRGTSERLAGRTVAIERRRSRGGPWLRVGVVRAGRDGGFVARWKPASAGRHQLRARTSAASSAGSGGREALSGTARLTVYRRVTATWYGPGFYGNRTACGQRLTRRTHGVAHRRLPCGAKVAIRVGGRSTVVPVVDRGPYVRGVAYDLTSATARRLGVMHTARIGAAVLTR